MTPAIYHACMEDVIYLSRCAVNGLTPDAQRVAAMDLSALYEAARTHMMTSIVAMALESAGIQDPDFLSEEYSAIRKNVSFDAELEVLSRRLSEAGIWYMPLKGALMKDYYPRIGMRQMADYDILFDAPRGKDVRDIMLSLGYSVKEYGSGHHDEYIKLPFYNFEMHRALIVQPDNRAVYRYYQNVKDRLLPDESHPLRFRFTPEDFYVFHLAHEYKHYSGAGIGLRPGLDIYVYLKRFGDQLDRAYIARELKKLGLTEFERASRELAMALYGDGTLTDEGRAMLQRHIGAGSFGSEENRVDQAVEQMGGGVSAKLRYMLRRIFVPREIIRDVYPFFWRHKLLIPFLPFYRLIRGMILHGPRLAAEIGAVFHRKKE